MSAKRRLTELRERKQLLVLQADLHRTLLRSEWVIAQDRLSWLNEARQVARVAGPWLAVGAAVTGLMTAWRRRKLASWIPTAFAAWRAIQSLKSGLR